MCVRDDICEFEATAGIVLPDSYKTLLACRPDRLTFSRDGRQWRFTPACDLSTLRLFGHIRFPYYKQLVAYETLMEWEADTDLTIPGSKLPFAAGELKDGIAVADYDGNVLFMQPTKGNSVWAFFHDGGNVEFQSNSLSEWLLAAKVEVARSDDTLLQSEALRIGIEDGIHFYVREILVPRGKLKWDDFFKREFGHEVWVPKEQALLQELSQLMGRLAVVDSTNALERNRLMDKIRELGKG